ECGRVTALTWSAEGWSLEWEPGAGGGSGAAGVPRQTAEGFGAVVLALPAEQVAGLLSGTRGLTWSGAAGQLRERVAGVSISPCWGVLLEFARRLAVEFDGAFVGNSPLRWVARNNSKPGRPERECWVLHASPEWSREYLEAGAEWVAGELEKAFWTAVGATGEQVVARQALRWRYALPESPLPEQFLLAEEVGLGVCGDWCGGPRVEGAWTSGARLGEELAKWWLER
ncbi:MAG: NAD(P)/FAD-dependent oxidoreductase, partial [Planctomycetaceae bacterium]